MDLWNSASNIWVNGAMERGVKMLTKTKTNWLTITTVFHVVLQFCGHVSLAGQSATVRWWGAAHQRIINVVAGIGYQDKFSGGSRVAVGLPVDDLSPRDNSLFVLETHGVAVRGSLFSAVSSTTQAVSKASAHGKSRHGMYIW